MGFFIFLAVFVVIKILVELDDNTGGPPKKDQKPIIQINLP